MATRERLCTYCQRPERKHNKGSCRNYRPSSDEEFAIRSRRAKLAWIKRKEVQ